MALLLRDAINAGVPPSLAILPMTPEEVAASYDNPLPTAEVGQADAEAHGAGEGRT